MELAHVLRSLCHYYCEKSLEYDVNALRAQHHDATPDGRATAGLHTKVSQQEPTAIRTKVHWHRDGAQVKTDRRRLVPWRAPCPNRKGEDESKTRNKGEK